jgi:hypothetical protein
MDPRPDPNPDPDLLVRDMDPRIRIQIHTKMSWIRNTGILLCQDYLGCRMEKNLMGKESWSKLGFADLDKNT